MFDELTDVALRRLGTRALWIDEFDEIPERLAFVYSETKWQNVFCGRTGFNVNSNAS